MLYEGGGRIGVANAQGVDFVALALAAGYPQAVSCESASELEKRLPEVLTTAGPTLVRLQIEVPATPRWSDQNPHGELPDWWFAMMGDDARNAAATLRP